jgi:hypothetical protein
MKTKFKKVALLALTLTALTPATQAQLAIPSDGSDGVLNITTNTVIDLSQSVTGTWSDNNAANAGKGIYDPNKWAVVFKYSSVTIASNATVVFKNHLTHAPVVWLVNADVTINGTVSLDGQERLADTFRVPEPGPGGFRGGARGDNAYGFFAGAGFGPGGYWNDNGSYSTYHIYGNQQIVPLIGGSGGGGYAPNNNNDWTGSGGGGAILIAAANNITVNGLFSANAGSSSSRYRGSGGAIRLIANQILGNGRLEAVSETYPGRIRIEANSTSASLTANPVTGTASPTPLVIWPAPTAPTVQVISVGGLSAPLDPKASLTGPSSDVTINTTNIVTIVLQSANFPTNGTVNVYVKPRNAAQSIIPATYVSGNTTLANWQVTTTMLPAYSIIQARAVAP